jgi:hypothetical protein
LQFAYLSYYIRLYLNFSAHGRVRVRALLDGDALRIFWDIPNKALESVKPLETTRNIGNH